MLQLIKEALGQNGMTPRDESPVTEVLNQVCPSSWRGPCKTAVQLLFAQAGLVSTLVQNAELKRTGHQIFKHILDHRGCIGSRDNMLSWIGLFMINSSYHYILS